MDGDLKGRLSPSALLWCAAELQEDELFAAAARLSSCVPSERQVDLRTPTVFTRWLFGQPRGNGVVPSIALVVGWREAKPCLAAIASARSGILEGLRPDSQRPPLRPAEMLPGGGDQVQVVVGTMIVVAGSRAAAIRIKKWAADISDVVIRVLAPAAAAAAAVPRDSCPAQVICRPPGLKLPSPPGLGLLAAPASKPSVVPSELPHEHMVGPAAPTAMPSFLRRNMAPPEGPAQASMNLPMEVPQRSPVRVSFAPLEVEVPQSLRLRQSSLATVLETFAEPSMEQTNHDLCGEGFLEEPVVQRFQSAVGSQISLEELFEDQTIGDFAPVWGVPMDGMVLHL